MKLKLFIISLLLLFSASNRLSAVTADTLWLSSDRLKVGINGKNGQILRFVTDKGDDVPFRSDSHAGFSFEGVQLHMTSSAPPAFIGERDSVVYGLNYRIDNDRLIIECRVENRSGKTFSPLRTRLILGVDSEMYLYPEWDDKYFTTLMRCERDFAWGYFMSPKGGILAFATEEPVASYALNYQFEGIKEWLWGHRIYTASLDLLHSLPLPERHPQHLTGLEAGESRTWTVHIGCVEKTDDVKPAISLWAGVPQIEAERYTISQGERIKATVRAENIEKAELKAPDGKTVKISIDGKTVTSGELTKHGVYTLKITGSGKQAEAKFYLRKPWMWYLSTVRDILAEYPPFFGNSCEAFYGYYPAFLAASHTPHKEKDRMLEERYIRQLPNMIDISTGKPAQEAVLPDRVQNFSTVAGQLVDLWEATGKDEYLSIASRVGDVLTSEPVQAADGSFRSKGTHYTAVIYPAKSMFELAAAEYRNGWHEKSSEHFNAAMRACEDLRERLDNIETEGDMTFEDGMITCSALQMGLAGLYSQDRKERDGYTEAARYMMEKHRCLEQKLIPDCRMNGATLRYWEALDIYFVPNQVMNSPHGWTAWKIYAVYYLYLLTGDTSYLTDMFNTLGACVQLLSLDGKLRWGFIPDPYVDAAVCVPGDEPYTWKTEDRIVGEQYLDALSPWMRPEDDEGIAIFGRYGASSDHTAHEIFKAMSECALTTAYVAVDGDSGIKTYNCRAEWEADGTLKIETDETGIDRIHVNTVLDLMVSAKMAGKTIIQNQKPGLNWIGKAPYPDAI